MRNVEGITNVNKMANANRLAFTFLSGSGTAGHPSASSSEIPIAQRKFSTVYHGIQDTPGKALELVPPTRMQQVQVNATPSCSL